MLIYRSLAEVPAGFGPSVVTIGKFDGVHAGHVAVIARVRAEAARQGLTAVVLTFDRNPLALLRPQDCPPELVSAEQKQELLAATGVDAVVLAVFDTAFAAQTPEQFATVALSGALDARTVFVGPDFRFGAGGSGTAATLRELGTRHGFTVTVIDEVRDGSGARASSSRIRTLLNEGAVAEAAELLGRDPSVRGTVVPGARRGRELGFPTANLSPASEGLIPADGVYAGWLTDRTLGGARFPAAISVGSNPTFTGVPPRQVEAHLLDQDLDLYGHTVEVAFSHRIRGQVAYGGVDALIAQIREDVRAIRALL